MASERENLAEAIRSLRDGLNHTNMEWCDLKRMVFDAAQAHLETLPKTVTKWCMRRRYDASWREYVDTFDSYDEAIDTLNRAAKSAGPTHRLTISAVEVPA